METLNDYLDKYKKIKKLKSDYQLSKRLGITRASISIIRNGGGVSKKTALKISEGTKEKIIVIWIASLAQKETDPTFKKALEDAGEILTIN